jgi:hypothetical protein
MNGTILVMLLTISNPEAGAKPEKPLNRATLPE